MDLHTLYHAEQVFSGESRCDSSLHTDSDKMSGLDRTAYGGQYRDW